MSNEFSSFVGPYSEGQILEIKVSMLEEIISDLNNVIESLTTELFANIQKELESGELEGKFKEVIVKELDKLKNKYDESLQNVVMLKFLLERYKKYAEEGPDGILTKTQDYINAHPEAMNKSIKDLKEEFEGRIPRIKNDENVYTKSKNKQKEIEEEIKNIEKNPEGDASEQREELATLKSNDETYKTMDTEVEDTVIKVNTELAGIAENIELLKKELNAYNHLWENYGTDTFDVEEYLAVKRQEVEGYGPDKEDKKDKIDDISKKGMQLLRSWEYGSENYYSVMIETIDGSPFDITCQVPYDVGDGMATIGPGIAVPTVIRDKDGNIIANIPQSEWEASLNARIASGLSTDMKFSPVGKDGTCISRDTLDRSAEGLMNGEYIPHVLGGVDYYNEVTGSNLELTQIQLDAIASLYWNTGANILYYDAYGDSAGYSDIVGETEEEQVEWLQEKTVEFYGNIDNANKDIESGDLKKAEKELGDAFSSLYSNGNPDELQKERIDDTINYYLNNYYWETRFEIDDEK